MQQINTIYERGIFLSNSKANQETKKQTEHSLEKHRIIVNVIDSLMGSGKTTWGINHFNDNQYERFIFITPFIKEAKRIASKCPALSFKEPIDEITKMGSFLSFLYDGENIAMSHDLFSRLNVTPSLYKTIASYGYHLIMDEVLEMIEPLEIHKDDIQILFSEKLIEVDENNRVIWTGKEYKGKKFDDIRMRSEGKNIIYYNKSLFIWLFPIEILEAFSSITILTFLFEGSMTKSYLDIYGAQYNYFYVNNGMLIPGKQDLNTVKKRLCDMIDIYDGPYNRIGEGRTALSSTWYKKKGNSGPIKALINNTRSYFRKKSGARSSDVLWSTFTKAKDRYNLNVKDYANGFCACNARATNEYKDRTILAYLINVYVHPYIVQYFHDYGIDVDQKSFALSQLLQWIWRSAIRENKPISIYLPSARMRGLLKSWLSDLCQFVA